MNPLTEPQIRASFVNCSKREAAQVTLPAHLGELSWDRLDYLGWTDRRATLRSYVVIEVDGAPVGIAVRSPERTTSPRRAVCAWCEDVYATDDVSMYVAPRSGPAGRRGDTIGTLICTGFDCSRNVRRKPTIIEAGEDAAGVVQRRIEGLRVRTDLFAREVLRAA
jgi:hypothetical protein